MSEALELATNHNTSPEKLMALLSENPKDQAILSAIAIHPNMTKDLLIELARNDDPFDERQTDYFCQTDENPAMNLLLLEHPNLVEDIYCEYFKGFPEICISSDEWDDSYGDFGPGEYFSFFYRLPDWFIEIAAKHKNEDLRAFVAARASKKYLEQLVKDESGWVRQAIASGPDVPDSVLEKLVEDEDYEVRETLTKNENIPASILLKIAEDEDMDIRRAVAKNVRCRDLDYYKQLRLVVDESKIEELIEVKNAFVFLMQRLAQDKEAYVREAVATNEHTPASILKKLLEDTDSEVREAAERNNNISASI